jgi:asparagine synthase (glutamine-hydrolysing)
VIEFAARLPTRWKVRGRVTKRILRTAFADLLPDDLARRGKAGFSVPLGAWLRGPLFDTSHDLLLGGDARSVDYLRRDVVSRILLDNREGRADHGKRIWALLNLEVWLRTCVPAASAGEGRRQ